MEQFKHCIVQMTVMLSSSIQIRVSEVFLSSLLDLFLRFLNCYFHHSACLLLKFESLADFYISALIWYSLPVQDIQRFSGINF